jgi:hypothetical protein
MHFDVANQQTDNSANTKPSIRVGTTLSLILAEDGGDATTTDAFRCDAIVDTVKPSMDFDGSLDFEVTWSLQKGSTLKYPGDA